MDWVEERHCWASQKGHRGGAYQFVLLYILLYIVGMADKPVVWLGSSLTDLRTFPTDVRQEAGFQLRRVQRGLMPTDSRPMSAIGPGVIEIRIHAKGEYRVLYVAKFAEAVYVLHAFQKKSHKTAQRDIVTARRQSAELKRIRARRGG